MSGSLWKVSADLRRQECLEEHVMSVADRCGLQDPDGVQLRTARAAWARWSIERPELRVVEDLTDIHGWSRSVSSREANEVLGVLASMTADDPEAITALVWALLPGAEGLARRLADLPGDSEGLVAGQLWIEVSQAHLLRTRSVAGAILACTRREVCAELGVGDLATRRDRVWAEAVCVADATQLEQPGDDYESQDELVGQVALLEMDAMEAHAINAFDAWLLDRLASVAARLDVPGRRGRMGLTTPAVVDELARIVHLSPRAIRRRATAALDRLAEYVYIRDDPTKFAVWRAQHPSCPVTPAEEMQLVITDECDAHFFRVQDLPPGGWAPDVAPERRRPATG
jgi:hypothetical protein